jgi:hypothetical protein
MIQTSRVVPHRPVSSRPAPACTAWPRAGWLLLPILWLVIAWPAWAAQVQASLAPARLPFGGTTTLTVTTDQLGATLDVAPLRADFDVLDTADATSVGIGNGGFQRQRELRLVLRPRRAGALLVPPLRMGSVSTPALHLQVDVADTPNNRRAGSGPVWMETTVSDAKPYVQQTVGVTLRLYTTVPLMDGALDLAAPDGATLQRIGDQDQQTSVVRDGRRLLMVERHYLLVPNRAGTLQLPAAQFQGRSVGGMSDVFGGVDSDVVRASGNPVRLDVQAIPAHAPSPWLPVSNLQLRWDGPPGAARAGEPVSLTVVAEADGASATQLPALQLPAIPGVQVFADPPEHDDLWRDGRPRTLLRQRFALLPTAAGTLTVPGLRLAWWDVSQGAARVAALPPLSIRVAAAAVARNAPLGRGPSATPGAVDAAAAAATIGDAPGAADGWPGTNTWIVLAAVFALLWLGTLVWALQLRERMAHAPDIAAAARAGGGESPPMRTLAELRRALDAGGLDEVATMLCGLARPPVATLDALVPLLADVEQQSAVRALQRAQWGGGDAVTARAAVRKAFAQGMHWRLLATATPAADDLPPLYPH